MGPLIVADAHRRPQRRLQPCSAPALGFHTAVTLSRVATLVSPVSKIGINCAFPVASKVSENSTETSCGPCSKRAARRSSAVWTHSRRNSLAGPLRLRAMAPGLAIK